MEHRVTSQCFIFLVMDIEDLATVMVLAPEVFDDEDVLLLLLAESELPEPVHYKYDRFRADTISDEEFRLYFRFKKKHIKELRQGLGLQDFYRSETNLTWTGDEGLCILLRRLTYPNRLCDLVPLFGRHQTELSVIINITLNEIHTRNRHRVMDVTQVWMDHAEYANAIRQKGAALTNCWGFLDGTQGHMCRPGVGQQSVFNGHKRIHSLKYQAVMCPDGMMPHFFGPIEGRRHDSALYYLSGLDQQLPGILDANNQSMCIYGDSAYALRRYLVTPFKGANISQIQHNFNKNMASVRVAVEWGFAKMSQIFAFLAFHHNQKVFLQPIAKYWIVGAILCNCHTCLYRSQTSKYFNLQPPALHDYLKKL